LTKRLWIADKGFYSTLEVGQGDYNSPQRSRLLGDLKQGLGLKRGSLKWCKQWKKNMTFGTWNVMSFCMPIAR
jgi:hypothetical protein